MELSALAQRIDYVSAGYADHYGFERSADWIVMKLTEEVGELVQAHLTSQGQGRARGLTPQEQEAKIAEELADVVCMCLVLAESKGINLEEAIAHKWFRYEQFHRDRGFQPPESPAATS